MKKALNEEKENLAIKTKKTKYLNKLIQWI
jgi:hypothetical protein